MSWLDDTIDALIIQEISERSVEPVQTIDVYPDRVSVLAINRGKQLVIDWMSVHPNVITSLARVGVPVEKRSDSDGGDYVISIDYESVLRLNLAIRKQRMRRIRALSGQVQFKRR